MPAYIGGKKVRLLGVTASNLTRTAQLDLFAAEEKERLHRIARAVDVIRDRPGDDAIRRARFLPGPQGKKPRDG